PRALHRRLRKAKIDGKIVKEYQHNFGDERKNQSDGCKYHGAHETEQLYYFHNSYLPTLRSLLSASCPTLPVSDSVIQPRELRHRAEPHLVHYFQSILPADGRLPFFIFTQ